MDENTEFNKVDLEKDVIVEKALLKLVSGGNCEGQVWVETCGGDTWSYCGEWRA